MAAWKYIKGSAEDFNDAPEWATVLFGPSTGRSHGFAEKWEKGANYTVLDDLTFVDVLDVWVNTGMVIAQRERVTSINDNRLATIMKPFETDNVNHPKHYTQGGIECIDAIKAATVGKSGIEAVCVANVVKYLWRYEEKNGVEDVKKARWYLERLISELERGE